MPIWCQNAECLCSVECFETASELETHTDNHHGQVREVDKDQVREVDKDQVREVDKDQDQVREVDQDQVRDLDDGIEHISRYIHRLETIQAPENEFQKWRRLNTIKQRYLSETPD